MSLSHRFFACLLALVLLTTAMAQGGTAFASKYAEQETVSLYDHFSKKWGTYHPVSITIAGQDIFSDTPGVIVDDVTLVPVATIFRSLGIAYEWHNATKEVSFVNDGKTIVIQIDNPKAKVAGVSQTLPGGVSPKIMTYKDTQGTDIQRTYVPLRFVSEVLGYQVDWNGGTRTVAINRKAQTISGVDLFWRTSAQRPHPEIRLKISGDVDVNSFVARGLDVGGQDQTIIEFQNTKFAVPNNGATKEGVWTYKITDGIFGLDRIEVQQTGTAPAVTRVTIFQNRRKGHHIYFDQTTGEMVVQLVGTVNQVKLDQIYSTDTIVIETSDDFPAYNTVISDKTIHVDVMNALLHVGDHTPGTMAIDQGKIKSVSYTQLDRKVYGSDAVRVSVTLTEKVTERNYFVEPVGTSVYVYVPEDSINNFGYVKQDTSNATLSVVLDKDMGYTSRYDEKTRTLTLEMPKASTNLVAFDSLLDDNILKRVSVTETESHYQVVAVLSENTTYQAFKVPDAIAVAFVNRVIRDSSNQGTLIVIDPGHGGRDPGAVGANIHEKEVVLKTSLYLQKELEKLGYRVYMTRSTDEYVNLFERATVANGVNADLFISIHANAHTTASPNGIEVLYGDTQPGSKKTDKVLAELIQKELVSATGATNRGVKYMPRMVVLRETKMPSVLVELGFVSNPNEARKLADSAYQQKMAQAMAKAVQAYFK